MTPKQIRSKIKRLQNKRTELYQQIEEIKIICQHPEVTKKYCGSRGNYDPSCDHYWIEWACPDCGKKWNTDQSRENRLKPGREIK